MSRFRIATYNIHKCRGLDQRVRPKRIAEVLKQIDADVIALQEVVGMDDLSHERNQVRLIAEELGCDYRIGENRRLNGGAYGNAILTRLPVLSEQNHDLSWKRNEPRGCLQVTVSLGSGTPVHIFNAHLGTAFLERRFQAGRLLSAVEDGTANSAPRVVLGDFNEWTRGLATQLFSRHFNSAEPRGRLGRAFSYPGIAPFLHLDHIYYDPHFELIDLRIHRSRLSLVASDHLPLVADLRLWGNNG